MRTNIYTVTFQIDDGEPVGKAYETFTIAAEDEHEAVMQAAKKYGVGQKFTVNAPELKTGDAELIYSAVDVPEDQL